MWTKTKSLHPDSIGSDSLQHLMLSHNELGPAGISDVLNSLTSRLRHLDMYSTAGDKRSLEVSDYFKAFLDKVRD